MKVLIRDVRRQCKIPSCRELGGNTDWQYYYYTTGPDQLIPFEGLFGFTSQTESFSGTLFRFPLMDARSRSRLYSNVTIAYDFLQQALDNYFEEASISLIFLNNVSTVEFYRRYPDSTGLRRMWKVAVTKSPSSLQPRATDIEVESIVYGELQQTNGGDGGRTGRCHIANWLVVYSENFKMDEVPEEMRLFGERHGLKASCAIAAPASAHSDCRGMLFMGVPTDNYLSLPVHISAVSIPTPYSSFYLG